MSNLPNSIEVLKKYKECLITFFNELISLLPQEGDLVAARLFLENQIPIETVMKNMLEKLNSNEGQLREMVQKRNENFFIENDIFDTLGKTKVNHFKTIWRSDQIDKEDKEAIWAWVDTFVKLADKYTESLS